MQHQATHSEIPQALHRAMSRPKRTRPQFRRQIPAARNRRGTTLAALRELLTTWISISLKVPMESLLKKSDGRGCASAIRLFRTNQHVRDDFDLGASSPSADQRQQVEDVDV